VSLQHAALETRPDAVAAEVAFWALLGFDRVEPPETLRDRAVWVQRDGSQIHLLLTDEPVAAPRGHVAIVAADHDDALGRLRDAGHPVEERARHWRAPRAFTRSPGGHRVEVMAWPPPTRPLPWPDPPLHDDVVALRPWTLDDVPWITAACQDPQIARYTRVPVPYTEADARAFVVGAEGARATGEALSLAVVDAGDGAPLGSLGLQRFAWEHAKGEIGYWVAAEARGRGIATRATRLVAHWALDALELARVELLAATGNAASLGVAERAGFRREGTLRSGWRLKEGRVDMAVFGLVASDRP
jgi:RimJ/RimL family protein N-acetyltransferase